MFEGLDQLDLLDRIDQFRLGQLANSIREPNPLPRPRGRGETHFVKAHKPLDIAQRTDALGHMPVPVLRHDLGYLMAFDFRQRFKPLRGQGQGDRKTSHDLFRIRTPPHRLHRTHRESLGQRHGLEFVAAQLLVPAKPHPDLEFAGKSRLIERLPEICIFAAAPSSWGETTTTSIGSSRVAVPST